MKHKFLLGLVLCPLLALQARPEDGSPGTPTTVVTRLRIKLFGVDKISDCHNQLTSLQEELKTLAYPSDWTIAVTCTPEYWAAAVRSFRNVKTTTAFSLLPAKLTVVNGDIFKGLRSGYRQVLAHELAHILCQCEDEAKANDLAWKLATRKVPIPRTARPEDQEGNALPAAQ